MRFYAEFPHAGIRNAINSIKANETALIKAAKVAIATTAFAIQKDAKILVPVDTGRLRASIDIHLYNDGLASEVGTNVEYAENVEFGTSRQRAQPYLFPAYEMNKTEFYKAIRQAFSTFRVAGK